MTTERDTIIDALRAWISQRPGLEFGNYGNIASYRAEVRNIGRDLSDARTLLRDVELSAVSADALKDAFQAYSGRLSWDGTRLSYITGQYWPTEYRKAVCAVAAQALWDHYRDGFATTAKGKESDGDAIRRCFRERFGRRIARRWFD